MFQFTPNNSGLEIKIQVKRFDATNSEKFKAMFNEHSIDKDLSFAHIDMSEVEFIDSSGVGALISVHKHLKENAEPVKILHPQAAVVSIIDLLRLTPIFKMETNRSNN